MLTNVCSIIRDFDQSTKESVTLITVREEFQSIGELDLRLTYHQ